eukprot:TRINITY_DN8399_c2_g4_i1.p1 TRINITY_DN8399_c2_g4~~TRINITY_DN8399_c2_g4_i1.p1  ORF type:complete len:243 (-),score=28.66 TRINITY_DN8399_c2_g4_i1:296-1024(-)
MSSNAQPLAGVTLPLPPVREDGEGNPILQMPEAPTLPGASPMSDLVDPLGPGSSPQLTTPHWGKAAAREGPGDSPPGPGFGNLAGLGGLSSMNEWAWEMGSEAGSVPSAWSKPSTVHSSVSRISNANGDGLIPGLIEGQRLSSVKPCSVPTVGGKVVVSLRREVPEGHWTSLSIVLVNGPVQRKLTPTGIKKGKKLCIEVPAGMTPGDYDVRLSFGEKIIHGAIPLAIRDGDADEDAEDFDD